MKTGIFLDTETTGFPDWKNPSGGETQPHLVQLAAILANLETREVLQSMNVIIKPDGWEIPQVTIDVHGITNELANQVGIPEALATHMFLNMCGDSRRIAHNRTFDQRIIRIATKRYCTEEMMEKWHSKENFDCTMLMSKPILKLLPKNRFGFKNPKLSEAYKHFTGEELEGAHDAMVDTKACMEVYWGLNP